MKKKLIVLSGFVFSLAPVVALAAGHTIVVGSTACVATTPVTDLTTLLCKIGQLLSAVVPVLVALGVVYFVWGVITYVIASDEEAKKSGKMRMIYGIIGLAVIVALWGIVRILTKTFDVGNSGTVTLPTINTF